MENASPQERIEALRTVREQRAGSANEEVETRLRRRLTARLGETFGVRTRARGASPTLSSSPEPEPTTAGAISEETVPTAATGVRNEDTASTHANRASTFETVPTSTSAESAQGESATTNDTSGAPAPGTHAGVLT